MTEHTNTKQDFDIKRAFSIVKYDLRGMTFVNFPYEEELVDIDQTNLFKLVAEELNEGKYKPSPCDIAEVPKGKGAVRPGSILTIKDQLVYTSLVNDIYTLLEEELSWSQGVVDYAYRLSKERDNNLWFRDQFSGWNDFKNNSINQINEGSAFVVVTDITGYYENIDHSQLFSDLRQIGCSDYIVSIIRSCLTEWGQLGTKGIPQGSSASHLLAKLYLNPVDNELKDLGYKHYRYVDDFRIFCESMAEAKQALVDLSAILRRRGLNLQSAKSKIVRADDAKPEIVGTTELIEDVINKMKRQTLDISADPYAINISIHTKTPNKAQLKVIKIAFNDFFVNADDTTFDKSLFHFLLNKLAQANDDSAYDYCLEQLERHPEEIKDVLNYLGRINKGKDALKTLVKYISSENAVYDYQNFKIIEWLLANGLHNNHLITFARKVAFDNNKPSYYRAMCKKILGQHGSTTDLARIKNSYNSSTSVNESCAVLCSLAKMEKARRNAFLTSVESASDFHKRACIAVRQRR